MATTNDPISDYLTRVRNAIMARHESMQVPKSRWRAPMRVSQNLQQLPMRAAMNLNHR